MQKGWIVYVVSIGIFSVILIVSGMVYDNSSKSSEEHIDNKNFSTMLVAGGCFWCVEADLEKLPGVVEVVSGYAGGVTKNPNYQNYAAGGHREVVQVLYDSERIRFEEIVIYAIKHMDPTDSEGSFGDRGYSYSPALYYETDMERQIIEQVISTINANGPYDSPLKVGVEERPQFWIAEDYHQDYYKGPLSGLKYKYYRSASGRDAFIEKHWSNDTGPTLFNLSEAGDSASSTVGWESYKKPETSVLKSQLETLAFKVTQQNGTEPSFSHPYDKEWGAGIYVDILSDEPLFSSVDKFDSGTGWPSFTKPISQNAVTEHTDTRFFVTRTEVRSRYADNHLGHVFTDGPADRGGLRYCMNGVALRFIPKDAMTEEGYEAFLPFVE